MAAARCLSGHGLGGRLVPIAAEVMAISRPQLIVTVRHRGQADARVDLTGQLDRTAVGGLGHRLDELLDQGVTTMLIDLAQVDRCDFRLLAVLERIRRRLAAVAGDLHVQGQESGVLIGFADADLPALLAAYRAAPNRSGRLERAGATDREQRLAAVCVELAGGLGRDYSETTLAARLVDYCLTGLGVSAATVLLADGHTARVAAASSERARMLESGTALVGTGPAADCLRLGEPVTSTDTAAAESWPLFAARAAEQGVMAVTAIPLRHGDTTVGVLDLLAARPGPMPRANLAVAQALARLLTITILSARRGQRTAAPPVDATTVSTADGPRRLDEHVTIAQATGILAERDHLTLSEAEAVLRDRAQHRSLVDAARQIVADSTALPHRRTTQVDPESPSDLLG